MKKVNKIKAKKCLKVFLKAAKGKKTLVELDFYCPNNAKFVYAILKEKDFKGSVLVKDNDNIVITNKHFI